MNLFSHTHVIKMAVGLCGLVTSAMYVIGVVMTMEVMVCSLPFFLMLELDRLYFIGFPEGIASTIYLVLTFYLALSVKWYCFVLGSMKIVVHNLDLFGLILRVSLMLSLLPPKSSNILCITI